MKIFLNLHVKNQLIQSEFEVFIQHSTPLRVVIRKIAKLIKIRLMPILNRNYETISLLVNGDRVDWISEKSLMVNNEDELHLISQIIGG